jgi:hypothetical protein
MERDFRIGSVAADFRSMWNLVAFVACPRQVDRAGGQMLATLTACQRRDGIVPVATGEYAENP